MAGLRFLCVTMALAVLAFVAGAPLNAEPNHIVARLVAETALPKAGSTVTLAVAMEPEKGWHGYWKNPGEAGFEPRFDWTLPKGLSAGPAAYPVPQPLLIGGLMNYVFEGPHALLVPVKLPADIAAGTTLPIALKLDYLACTDQICVPQHAELEALLTVGDGAIAPARRAEFDRWRSALPTALDATARFVRANGVLRLAVPFPASAGLGDAHFFPAAAGMITDAGPQTFGRSGDTLIAEIPAPNDASGAVSGVLALGDGRGLMLTAAPGQVPAMPTGGIDWIAIATAFFGAVLGGLILNVMPCVFPILSLKALSLAKAGGDERSARRDALGYTAGAVLACLALGGAVLALRAAGSSIGWAFQLQDPRVIVVLLVLVTAIAFNLAGLFELPTVGGGLATGNSVMTGALAAFIATPCTGPFMGAALGAALVLPTAAALAVFGGLGLGLALPFLLLGFVPGLRRLLPKPGGWMATLRHILSVPMFLTALGLVWLLTKQAGADAGAFGLLAALVAGLVFWWTGSRQRSGKTGLILAALLIVVTTAAVAVWLPMSGPAATAQGDATHEKFSETRLAALRAEGRPVFVYFTADWCLTCKVNERIAIDRPEVSAAFKANNVAVLVGDWTRADPEIGRFLASHGRSGVPLYLFYPKGGEAQVLPQVLTPATLTALN